MSNNKYDIKAFTKFMGRNNVYYIINISLKNKYVYIETPKAACSTTKRTLMNLELEDTGYRPEKVHLNEFSSPFIKPFQLSYHDFENIMESREFFKFCFVRNPYSRVLSCYLDKICGDKPQKKLILQALGLDPEKLDTELSFLDFVEGIKKQDSKIMDIHWCIQYNQLFAGLINFDFIGKVESFDKDIQFVNSALDNKLKNHFENVLRHKTDATSQMQEYYTPKIMKLVNKIYKDDFKHFNYDPDTL